MFEKIKEKLIFSFLENGDSEKIFKKSEKDVIKFFKRAAKNVPAYREILNKSKINISKINSIEDFKKLPILSKETLFLKFGVKDLCFNGDLNDVVGGMTSSGYSGRYAFGVISKKDVKNTKNMVGMLLRYFFGNKNIACINAEPMGVYFDSPYPIFNTSVREDMVLTLLNIFKNEFDNFVIFGEPLFIKRIIDYGKDIGYKTYWNFLFFNCFVLWFFWNFNFRSFILIFFSYEC